MKARHLFFVFDPKKTTTTNKKQRPPTKNNNHQQKQPTANHQQKTITTNKKVRARFRTKPFFSRDVTTRHILTVLLLYDSMERTDRPEIEDEKVFRFGPLLISYVVIYFPVHIAVGPHPPPPQTHISTHTSMRHPPPPHPHTHTHFK